MLLAAHGSCGSSGGGRKALWPLEKAGDEEQEEMRGGLKDQGQVSSPVHTEALCIIL